MAIQAEYHFMNTQDCKANNGAGVIGTNVNQMNAANSHKTGWWVISRNNTSHGTQGEIGGMTWVTEVETAAVDGGNVTVYLATKSANTLNAASTTIASVAISNGTAVGTKYAVRIPAGTKRLAYLGVYATTSGNVGVANLTSFLWTGAGAETPSK